MAYQHGTLDQAWETARGRHAAGAVGRWSWPVSLAVIAGLSALGWGAIIVGIARLLAA
ncbi:MAG: hypothetical protein BroJett029_36770 [Alphaproteobacteria bacterium]|nr:MAG: hypothetical protein BroJett029_36770 [Alphaproteobacteria bacterium]